MNINEAITALENGERVARASWNKNSRFIKYIFVSSISCDAIPGDDQSVLLMRIAENQVMLWQAKEEDLEATDWEYITDSETDSRSEYKEIPQKVVEVLQSIADDLLSAVRKLEDETSPEFVQWLISRGYLSRDDIDIETLRDIYEAMDDDDKQ